MNRFSHDHPPIGYLRPLLGQMVQKQDGEGGLPDFGRAIQHHTERVAQSVKLLQHREIALPDHNALAQTWGHNIWQVGWHFDAATGTINRCDELGVLLERWTQSETWV